MPRRQRDVDAGTVQLRWKQRSPGLLAVLLHLARRAGRPFTRPGTGEICLGAALQAVPLFVLWAWLAGHRLPWLLFPYGLAWGIIGVSKIRAGRRSRRLP